MVYIAAELHSNLTTTLSIDEVKCINERSLHMVSFSHAYFSGQPKIVSAGILWFVLFLSCKCNNWTQNAMSMILLRRWVPQCAEQEESGTARM